MKVILEKNGYKLISRQYDLIWPSVIEKPNGEQYNLTEYVNEKDMLDENIKNYFETFIDLLIEEDNIQYIKNQEDWWNYSVDIY